ncbi:MAG: hypothetical protein PHO38_10405, partial [Acidithiobacillus sp.]|nr:hypothetical protein [Acidithiobacillus sp.]
DIGGLSPCRIRNLLVPSPEGQLGTGVELPEVPERGHGNNSHDMKSSPDMGHAQASGADDRMARAMQRMMSFAFRC